MRGGNKEQTHKNEPVRTIARAHVAARAARRAAAKSAAIRLGHAALEAGLAAGEMKHAETRVKLQHQRM